MTQQADDMFLADMAKAAGAFGVGWGCAGGNMATILIGFVIFHLAIRLEKEVLRGL